MPRPSTPSRMLPISMDIARDLVVDASPTAALSQAHGAYAGSVRFLLLALSQASASARGTDDELMEREYRLTEAFREGVAFDRLPLDLAALRRDMGNATLLGVRDALSRCCDSLVALRGEPDYGLNTPTNKAFLGPGEERVAEADRSGSIGVERTLLAAATPGLDGTLEFDPGAMARFRCRYSPVLYLRLLAWRRNPAAIPRGCGPSWRSGTLWMTIPLDGLQEALGFRGMARASQVERVALVPAVAEMAAAGLRLTWKWVTNYRGERVGLRLSVAADESLARLKAEARAQARDEAAERRRARAPERRAERAKRPRKRKRPAPSPASRPEPAYLPARALPPGTRGVSALRATARRPSDL